MVPRFFFYSFAKCLRRLPSPSSSSKPLFLWYTLFPSPLYSLHCDIHLLFYKSKELTHTHTHTHTHSSLLRAHLNLIIIVVYDSSSSSSAGEGTNRRTNCCRRRSGRSSLGGVTSYKLEEKEEQRGDNFVVEEQIVKLIKLQESAEKSSRTVLMFVAEKEREREGGKGRTNYMSWQSV